MPAPAVSVRTAELALVVATLFWGCGFTWAKAAGEDVHRNAELPHGSGFGPLFILALRFLIAGFVLLLVGRARVGWTWRGARRIAVVGGFLAAGSILQHLGLDRTSEAVTAFLTNLTVLLVPLASLVLFRKPPAPILWLGVALATVGIWLLTGAARTGFGAGEVLALGCAVAFTGYILSVDRVGRTEDPWRLTAGQFLVTGVACAIACLLVDRGPENLRPDRALELLKQRDVWRHLVLLTALPTLLSFGLMNFFQPRIDATRAALIYLIEPIAAAAYAYVSAGREMERVALVGAALIVVANVTVEVVGARRARARA